MTCYGVRHVMAPVLFIVHDAFPAFMSVFYCTRRQKKRREFCKSSPLGDKKQTHCSRKQLYGCCCAVTV